MHGGNMKIANAILTIMPDCWSIHRLRVVYKLDMSVPLKMLMQKECEKCAFFPNCDCNKEKGMLTSL